MSDRLLFFLRFCLHYILMTLVSQSYCSNVVILCSVQMTVYAVMRMHDSVISICFTHEDCEFVHFITRRRNSSFAEYCKHFVARLNDVHTFGYNSAESERIWMEFGELRVYYLELSLTNFGRDPRRSGSGRASRNFVFLSIK